MPPADFRARHGLKGYLFEAKGHLPDRWGYRFCIYPLGCNLTPLARWQSSNSVPFRLD